MTVDRDVEGGGAYGRREHRKHLTRQEFLAAGRRLFAEKGLYDARIEDLSRQAGVAKGTLYLYFEDKNALMEAVVRNGFDELLGHVQRRAGRAQSREQAIAEVLRAHLEFLERNPDLMRIFHQVRGLLKFRALEMRSLRRILVDYLAALARVLSLHPGGGATQDLETARLLFGAVSGIASVRASVQEPPTAAVSAATLRALQGMACAFEGAGAGRRPGRVVAATPRARARR